jgi:glyceraldehyde 3-phosphate dehydrogenase
MTIKVGINGMGRIGRMVLRSIIESNNKNIEIKHINNRTGPEACSTLIKYDSIHGKFNAEIQYDENHLIVNKSKILFTKENQKLIMFLSVLVSLIPRINFYRT